jgi:translation initiation factor IF-3
MIFTHQSFRALSLASPLQLGVRQDSLASVKRLLHSLPKNKNIKFSHVHVVNAEGKLDPLRPLSELLVAYPRKEFVIQQVTEDRPIVRIIDSKTAFEKEKAIKRANKAAEKQQINKEIQMTWGVAMGDLTHKISKVRAELEKNNRVDLIFAPKKRQAVPSPKERGEKAGEVLEMLKDVGQESKPRTMLKSHLTLHLEAKPMDTT